MTGKGGGGCTSEVASQVKCVNGAVGGARVDEVSVSESIDEFSVDLGGTRRDGARAIS